MCTHFGTIDLQSMVMDLEMTPPEERQVAMQEIKIHVKRLYEQGRYQESVAAYRALLTVEPDNYLLLCYLAQSLIQVGHLQKAKSVIFKAINLQPQSEKGYHIAGKVAERMGDLEMCSAVLAKGIKFCPNPRKLRDFLEKVQNLRTAKRSQSVAPTPKKSKLTRALSTGREKAVESEGSSSSLLQHGFLLSDKPGSSAPHASSSEKTYPDESCGKSSSKSNDVFESACKDFENDTFRKTLQDAAKEQNLTYSDVARKRVEKFKNLCKQGSEAYLDNFFRKAGEKFKEAIEMIDDLPLYLFEIEEIDHIVLKYMLCTLWIESSNYQNIVSAIQMLKVIEDEKARMLPSVYYLLSLAYHKLNRNQAALEYLHKGLSFLEKNIQFQRQPFPQADKIIPETCREVLAERLKDHQKRCRCYTPPDVVCRFHDCLSVNSHVIPSNDIYYSDPDFSGFVSAHCEAKCRIIFHPACWRAWKETTTKGRKVTDKDILGHECFTDSCRTSSGNPSIIVQIDIVGTDGSVKSTCKLEVKLEAKPVPVKKEKKLEHTSNNVANKKEPAGPKPAKPLTKKLKKTSSESREVEMEACAEASPSINSKLDRLKQLREKKFGFQNDVALDPEKESYGIQMEDVLPNDFGIVTCDPEANVILEFVLSMFYQFLKVEGPQKKSDVLKKWEEEKVDLDPTSYVQRHYKCICDLLLESSYYFCQVGQYICTFHHVQSGSTLVKNQLQEFTEYLNNASSFYENIIQSNKNFIQNLDLSESEECDTIQYEKQPTTSSLSPTCEPALDVPALDETDAEEPVLEKPALEEPAPVEVIIERKTVECQTDFEESNVALQESKEKPKSPDEEPSGSNSEVHLLLEKVATLETLLLHSYTENDSLVKKVNLLESEKKILEEKNRASEKISNEMIQTLKLEMGKSAENVKKLEDLKVLYSKKARKYEQEIKVLNCVIEEERKSRSELTLNHNSLQETEKFCLVTMNYYASSVHDNLVQKCKRKMKEMDVFIEQYSNNIITYKKLFLSAKRTWESALVENKSKFLEFTMKMKSVSTSVFENNERLMNTILPPLPASTVPEDPFSFLLQKLIEDNSQLAAVAFENIPEGDWSVLKNEFLTCDKDEKVSPPSAFSSADHTRGRTEGVNRFQQSMSGLSRISRSPSVSSTRSDSSQKSLSINGRLSKKDSLECLIGHMRKNSDREKDREETAANHMDGCTSSPSRPAFEVERTIRNREPAETLRSGKSSFPNLLSMASVDSAFKLQPSNTLSTITKILSYLGKKFPNNTDTELYKCLENVRRNNGNTLTGLDLAVLVEKIKEQLKARSKNVESMLFEKFSGPAWSNLKEKYVWKNEDADESCVICFEGISTMSTVKLSCKHEFHEHCVRKWLSIESVCPKCRKPSLMPDEYPPLM